MRARLEMIRKVLGLSQNKFASRLSLTGVYYNRIEKGCYKISEKMIGNLSSVYGVNPEWFKTGNGEMFDYSTQGFIRTAFEVRNNKGGKYIADPGVADVVKLVIEKSKQIKNVCLW